MRACMCVGAKSRETLEILFPKKRTRREACRWVGADGRFTNVSQKLFTDDVPGDIKYYCNNTPSFTCTAVIWGILLFNHVKSFLRTGTTTSQSSSGNRTTLLDYFSVLPYLAIRAHREVRGIFRNGTSRNINRERRNVIE